jgi:hypothetical protein
MQFNLSLRTCSCGAGIIVKVDDQSSPIKGESHNMRKLVTMMLGLSLVFGLTSAAFGFDDTKSEKKEEKKKSKKKKEADKK